VCEESGKRNESNALQVLYLRFSVILKFMTKTLHNFAKYSRLFLNIFINKFQHLILLNLGFLKKNNCKDLEYEQLTKV